MAPARPGGDPALDRVPDAAVAAGRLRRGRRPCAARSCLERAFGLADLGTGETLTPRHRFRTGSHSKSFTAAGIMLLRERGRLGLDDAVGRHVPGLHADTAAATIGQLLSHSAGVTRDGPDSGQFTDRRPYPDAAEVLADLGRSAADPGGVALQVLEPRLRPARPGHREGDGRALRGLDQAGGGGRLRPGRDRAGHAAIRPADALRPRPYRPAAARRSPGDPRRFRRPARSCPRPASPAPPQTSRGSSPAWRRMRRQARFPPRAGGR